VLIIKTISFGAMLFLATHEAINAQLRGELMRSHAIRYIAILTIAFVVASCGKPSPVGKWVESDGSTTEFLSDGTVVATDKSGTFAGKWSNAADNKILIQMTALGTTAAAYGHFDGDNLVLEDGQHVAILHRASEDQSAAATPQAPVTISIQSAIYGTPGAGRTCIATQPVASQCNGKTACSVPASNDLCGDPNFGVQKELSVTYSCGTVAPTTRSVLERDTLQIECQH
jgi:hypothetical protein